MPDEKPFHASLGEYQITADGILKETEEKRIIPRIWKFDYTVWKDDPTEITNRLGWLDSPEVMDDAIPEMKKFVDAVRKEGYTHALLLGMGGSSLAPEVFRKTFGVKKGFLDLAVLDSTDPGAVSNFADNLDPQKTLYIVSTKSGGTVETMSFMKFFYNLVQKSVGRENTGRHFIAITDRGSGLEPIAQDLNFRKIFLNDPNIGGRYSALSFFGLVPAALIGMDLARLLQRGGDMARLCHESEIAKNPGALLGSVMGALATAGQDKLTLVTSPQLFSFGAWVEQLIAESTGKDGKGILPVDGEQILSPEYYGPGRLFVYLKLKSDNSFDKETSALATAGFPLVQLGLDDLYDIGGEFFRWEIATAIAGSILQINPFDQPNVESAKVLARNMVDSYRKDGSLPQPKPVLQDGGISVYGNVSGRSIPEVLTDFLFQAILADKNQGYVAIQAYLQPTTEVMDKLQQIRTKIQQKYKAATTVGLGPRFLHSTGQLHKGDGGKGLFIQLTADSENDPPIPDTAGSDRSSISFGVLKMAQALGDNQALTDAGRKVIRFHLGKDVIGGLERIVEIYGN
jgi:glucose-6-phosphate isomerase